MNVATPATKQEKGKLLTHFSVGWHWGIRRDGSEDKFKWHGNTGSANSHMIDIFDSVDVQVSKL